MFYATLLNTRAARSIRRPPGIAALLASMAAAFSATSASLDDVSNDQAATEQVVVTAQKRDERRQDAPVSITPVMGPGDLSRIEVWRGPEGTLYGVNSVGGVITAVTAERQVSVQAPETLASVVDPSGKVTQHVLNGLERSDSATTLAFVALAALGVTVFALWTLISIVRALIAILRLVLGRKK